MRLVLVAALLAALLSSAAWAASCQDVSSFTPSCEGGSVVQDAQSGRCRTIKCALGSSSMQALACDKPDGTDAQFFELYKQATTGTGVRGVCLGSTCVGTLGFAKSPAYTCAQVCAPSAEVCDGKDNDCDGSVDEDSVCAPACAPSAEVCDGKDNDCDGSVDENACSSSVDGVEDLAVSCTGGCTKLSDATSGTCRTVRYQLSAGTVQAQACEKGGGWYEAYRQQSPYGATFKVCFANGCLDRNWGFVRFQVSGSAPSCTPSVEVCDGKDNDCDGQADENSVCAPACAPSAEVCDGKDNDCDGSVDENACSSSFPLKTNIVSTIFWVGQHPSADTGWTNNYDSAWDTWWVEHYGGYDDPNNRNGWYPAGFTPKENPFYVAIPYTDYSYTGRKWNAFDVVPWANEKSSWGPHESMIKNRWVKVIKGSKTAYAQVENAGPGPTDDWPYVFGSDAQPNTDFGWKAGIDVSPAVRDYLGLGPVDVVSWQWVKASDVPAGPWKNIVTTRQSCWGDTMCP